MSKFTKRIVVDVEISSRDIYSAQNLVTYCLGDNYIRDNIKNMLGDLPFTVKIEEVKAVE